MVSSNFKSFSVRTAKLYGCPMMFDELVYYSNYLFYYKFYRENNLKNIPLISLTVTVESPVKGLKCMRIKAKWLS